MVICHKIFPYHGLSWKVKFFKWVRLFKISPETRETFWVRFVKQSVRPGSRAESKDSRCDVLRMSCLCLLFIRRFTLRARTPPCSYLFDGLTVSVLSLYNVAGGKILNRKIKNILTKIRRKESPLGGKLNSGVRRARMSRAVPGTPYGRTRGHREGYGKIISCLFYKFDSNYAIASIIAL